LNWWIKSVLVVMAFVIVACGNKQDETNPVRRPVDPTAGNQPLVPAQPGIDPRLPDLSRAVTLTLKDSDNFTGLIDLAKVFVPVMNAAGEKTTDGDTLVSMVFSNDRATTISSQILIAFSDKLGFWAAQQKSFDGTAFRTSNGGIDAIHSDSEFTLRVISGLVGDDLYGTVYYRVRQPGENQCKQVVVTCTYSGGTGSLPPCNYPAPDTATPCRNYMDKNTQTAVKELGTFKARYSNWAVLGN